MQIDWKTNIKMLALEMVQLQQENLREQCPKCMDKEKTLSLSLLNSSTVLYQCFRMKCGVRGVIHTQTGQLYRGTPSTVPSSPPPPLTTTLLDEDKIKELPVQDLSIAPRWNEKRGMVMYPVLDHLGKRLGYVQRHYAALNGWWNGPKAMNIIEDTSSPWCHFPAKQEITDTIYIVEDLPSAEAMRKYVPVCALLGTNVTDEVLGLLLKIGVRKLNICLDNDALAKSAKLKRKFALTFDEVNVIFVDKDPKDMTTTELKEKFI